MECDVAVLGGGPGGYTAAIRAAQLGAKTVCIEQEPELGGTCLRVGCIPTKAWVQTAFALKEAEESFAKFGVEVGEARLDLPKANEWKAGVVKQMTGGVASLFKANGVEWVKGARPLHGREHDRGRGRRGRRLQECDRRHRLVPDPAADRGARLAALRRLDGAARTGARAEAPGRARRRDHRLRVRLDLPAFRLGGDDRRDAAEPDPDGGRGRGEGAREAVRQARDHARARAAVHEGRGPGRRC